MIRLIGVEKHYEGKKVIGPIDWTIRLTERWGLLGHNGSGKSTLMRVIGKAEDPSRGKVIREGRISWPLAFGGGFQGGLTGIDNILFIARLYGIDEKEAVERVESFAELGRAALHKPVVHYSSGMRARLAFGLSIAVDFDFFLIDEIVLVGDHRFQEKCHRVLHEERPERGFLLISHDMGYIRNFCHRVAVLEKWRLICYDSVEEGIERYHTALQKNV